MSHSQRSLADYDESYEPIREARQRSNGRQPGDPQQAVAAVMRVIADDDPPRHLVLGSGAVKALFTSRAEFQRELKRWGGLTASTDFPDGS